MHLGQLESLDRVTSEMFTVGEENYVNSTLEEATLQSLC